MTPHELCLAAADVIERNGWTQGELYDATQHAAGVPVQKCAVCLLGAVNLALVGHPDPDPWDYPLDALPVFDAVFELIERQVGCWPNEWNDHEARTAGEVAELLRRIAGIAAQNSEEGQR